jgi:enoyl-CoA hydratase/carnithine racemase
MPDDELVHAEVDAGVVTITLDSPANRNALSTRLVTDLNAALDVAEAAVASGDGRVIVLDHVAPAFCAGADLKERRTGAPDSAPMVRAMTRLMDVPVPTIAAVKGPARAGGVGLMASCDLAVVLSSVEFAFTEVRIGVAAAIISVPILARVNASKLRSAFLTGETFTAESARDAGLVTHVTNDVDRVVDELCAGVKMGAPRGVAETKAFLRLVPTLPRDEAFERMRTLSDELFSGPDGAEGMAAFAEKRPPRWQT